MNRKVLLTALAVALLGFLGIAYVARTGQSASVRSGVDTSTQAVHSVAWYVAHPTVLKQDDARCVGNPTLPAEACQNAAAADMSVSATEMQKAAQQNSAAMAKGQ